MSNIIGAPAFGITAAEVTQGKGFGLGDVTFDSSGNQARYVIAGSNVSQYMWVSIDGSNVAIPLNGSNALTVGEIGVAHYGNIASGEYGFVVIAGRPLALMGASCNPNVPIYTTDTVGVMDDATASASNYLILGVKCHVTNGTSGVGAARVILNAGATIVIPRAVGHS